MLYLPLNDKKFIDENNLMKSKLLVINRNGLRTSQLNILAHSNIEAVIAVQTIPASVTVFSLPDYSS